MSNLGMIDYPNGQEVRLACRNGRFTGPTPGLAPGYVQANLVILPRDWAFDFLLFCQRNPKPCPLLDVCDPGDPEPKATAPGADIRTDLPRYRVWRHGVLSEERTEIRDLWQNDFVSFLIGCSFSFEQALINAGVPVRHIEEQCNVPMYRTQVECVPAGRFHGKLVVSMRPLTRSQFEVATRICATMPLAHGAPIQWGGPTQLGIKDLAKPDYGDSVSIDFENGQQPAFWACGVTPQAALLEAQPPFAITHAPGHMFLTDWTDEQLQQRRAE